LVKIVFQNQYALPEKPFRYPDLKKIQKFEFNYTSRGSSCGATKNVRLREIPILMDYLLNFNYLKNGSCEKE